MERKLKTDSIIRTCLGLTSNLMELAYEQIWSDYDREGDVLYLSFRKPQRAKETIEFDEDILIRRDGNKIVGITILNASSRATEKH